MTNESLLVFAKAVIAAVVVLAVAALLLLRGLCTAVLRMDSED